MNTNEHESKSLLGGTIMRGAHNGFVGFQHPSGLTRPSQPGGLEDCSRGSSASDTPGKRRKITPRTPEGCQIRPINISRTPSDQSLVYCLPPSGLGKAIGTTTPRRQAICLPRGPGDTQDVAHTNGKP